jgi:hypothetical protein
MLGKTELKPHLPYHVVFQIVVAYTMKMFTQNIFPTVVDEGTSTCIMSLAFWKAIGQTALSPSPTLLTSFERSFIPTTWHHPLFSRAVRREDRVCRG